jgi:small subunit ribosomal protein S3
MGRKVHPIGMRLGINQPWQGRWFAEGKTYREQLHQDFGIRILLLGGTSKGGAAMNSRANHLRKELPEMVLNGKAGILIGRKGEGVKKIRAALEALVGKKIDLDVKEIESPDTDATLVARNVADQLERRIAYRRAMKRAIQQAMRQGAKGIKIMVGGRLGGAEMSRDVWLREGRVPLQTLRANIDFARTEALTTYGQIGVKVWIYKGEVVPEVEEKVETTEGVYVSE